MQSTLSQCFLGKKVTLDDKKTYTIKYQDNRNKDGVHVLLFDNEKPVIFGVMRFDGSFRDAFFINKKSTHSSKSALNRYNHMVHRKASSSVTQEQLKDALRSREVAKMKNEHIYKLLIDEHLEDISNGWPSRLLLLQKNEHKSDDSLINSALKDALKKANPQKAFYFLTLHRFDDYIPELIHHINNRSTLIDQIFAYYSKFEDKFALFNFLKLSAKKIPLENTNLTQIILSETYSFDLRENTHYFKPLFLLFYKRVKSDKNANVKVWLATLSNHPLLKEAIRSITNRS